MQKIYKLYKHMDKQKALDIIKQACASVVGNLETHTAIQQAIKVVENELNKEVEPKK